MDADWIKSPSARRILVHWADPRPAWLWSGDGSRLLWRNGAARFFAGKLKKSGVKLVAAAPIKGQVTRLIRLGSAGRSSLSRIQFLAGDKPVSQTCTVTPLALADGQSGLLVVGVDPIASDLLEGTGGAEAISETLFAPGTEYLVIDDDGHVSAGSPRAMDELTPALAERGELGKLLEMPPGEERTVDVTGSATRVVRFTASPRDASLLLFGTPAQSSAAIETPPDNANDRNEPMLPMGLPPEPAASAPGPIIDHEDWVDPRDVPDQHGHSLTSLFDRLAEDTRLFAGLDDGKAETDAGGLPTGEPGEDPSEDVIAPALFESDDIAAIIAFDEPDDGHPATADVEKMPEADEPAAQLHRVTGRGFAPSATEQPAPADPPEAAGAAGDPDSVERVSRYNFDELSRILADRVGSDLPQPAAPPQRMPASAPQGQLVSLTGETFILNRLPLGILVFRDQKVLFANRSITEMVGFDSVDEIRQAGLDAIFPATGEQAEAGPVNHLVRRDGMLVPVTARLQSISWQGKPALMLSASATEVRTGHEAAVRAFAELVAQARGDGFIELTRQGVVQTVSATATVALRRDETQLVGKPLSGLISPGEIDTLREFLERPARFAETARPCVILRAAEPAADLLIFAQGQAGIVTGYFALVRRRDDERRPALAAHPDEEPSLLTRVSRGVRRPLNTVIGFADVIGSTDFGAVGSARQAEYARDIKTAGLEIAALVDELDDYARLRDGRYVPRPVEVDLADLLESCVLRARPQAGAARVLVRSAISENLPRVKADRASLGQAVLNLLANAIGQSVPGGSVILSAQGTENGPVTIKVRDSGPSEADVNERFVVFRDGIGRDGEALAPIRSSVGLTLTRSLLSVNHCSLEVGPAGPAGTLFSIEMSADAIVAPKATAAD